MMDIKEILERQIRDLDEKSKFNLINMNSLKDNQALVYETLQKAIDSIIENDVPDNLLKTVKLLHKKYPSLYVKVKKGFFRSIVISTVSEIRINLKKMINDELILGKFHSKELNALFIEHKKLNNESANLAFNQQCLISQRMFITLHMSKILELPEDDIKRMIFDFESRPAIAALEDFYYQMQVTLKRY